MWDFELNGVPRVVFGAGRVAALGEIVRAWGARAMVVHNGGALGRVGEALAAAGVAVTAVRQAGEPTVAHVDAAARVAREAGCEVVVGAGGGSAIDAAKAVAALLTNGGSALDYLEVVGGGKTVTAMAAPLVAVPTTAGTGAEATRNAVIAVPERKFKASMRSPLMLPRVALIDPELGADVPAEVSARCGMDALCQCVEAATSRGASAMTLPLSLRGVELCGRSLRRAVADGRDGEARREMALAALLSGISLAHAGLGAAHGFAAPLGANFPVPHGTVCGVLLPGVVEANVAELRRRGQEGEEVLGRYAQVGRALTGAGGDDDEEAIAQLIEELRKLAADLRLPVLGTFGLAEADVAPMVALARKASSMRYNPVELSDDALAGILRGAM